MIETKTLNLGDPCPACGGELRPARVPSDEEYKRASDKENPIVLPPNVDTASPAQRKELGALHRCGECGYVTRFKDDGHAHDQAETDNGDAGEKRPARPATRR